MQKVVENLKSIELREQIVELRTILADVREENLSLREKVGELEGRLKRLTSEGTMVPEGPVLYLVGPDGPLGDPSVQIAMRTGKSSTS